METTISYHNFKQYNKNNNDNFMSCHMTIFICFENMVFAKKYIYEIPELTPEEKGMNEPWFMVS